MRRSHALHLLFSLALAALVLNLTHAQSQTPAAAVSRTDATSRWAELKSRTQFKFYSELDGPSLDYTSGRKSFNVLSDHASPVNWYQSIELSYLLNPDLKLGLQQGFLQNLARGVQASYGLPYLTSLVTYNPQVYLVQYNLINSRLLNLQNTTTVDLPVRSASVDSGFRTALRSSQSWRAKLGDHRWNVGINTDFIKRFYVNTAGWNTFYFSVGHHVGYLFSPQWELESWSVFDVGHKDTQTRWWDLNNGFVDHVRIALKYNPWINTLQITPFVQSPIYHRTTARMIAGMELTLWL